MSATYTKLKSGDWGIRVGLDGWPFRCPRIGVGVDRQVHAIDEGGNTFCGVELARLGCARCGACVRCTEVEEERAAIERHSRRNAERSAWARRAARSRRDRR